MASVNIEKDEFVDFVVAFLLDKMIKEDEIFPNHDEFNDLIKVMKGRGIDKTFLSYYINSSPLVRNKYKSNRKVFTPGSTDTLTIGIRGSVEAEKETSKTLKDIVKKAVKMIAAHKRRSGFPLNEEKLDKIIERVMREEGFLIETKEQE